MAKEKLDAKVLEWLEKQGYPLEMHVAEEFGKAGFDVAQSEFYMDPDSNQPREIDVLATDALGIQPTQRVVGIRFVVECKQSRDKPWVMFVPQGQRYIRRAPSTPVANNQGRAVLAACRRDSGLRNLPFFEAEGPTAYGMVQSLKDSNDASYSATMQVAKATIAIANSTPLENRGLRRMEEQASVCFAVIVIDGQLFSASRDPADAKVALREVQEHYLKIGNPTLGADIAAITVVTKEGLAKYLEKAAAARDAIFAWCGDHRKEVVEAITLADGLGKKPKRR